VQTERRVLISHGPSEEQAVFVSVEFQSKYIQDLKPQKTRTIIHSSLFSICYNIFPENLIRILFVKSSIFKPFIPL
jgi:hypothetical protein